MYCKNCLKDGHGAGECNAPRNGRVFLQAAALDAHAKGKRVVAVKGRQVGASLAHQMFEASRKLREETPGNLGVTSPVTPVTEPVTVTSPVTLHHCPTCRCGFKPRTAAERQAAHRARKGKV